DGKSVLLRSHSSPAFSWCDLTARVPRAGVPCPVDAWTAAGSGEIAVPRLMPDGKTLVLGTNQGEVLFLDRTPKGLVERTRFKVDAEPVYRLELSPDGRLLATASSSGVKLWDLAGKTPALRSTLPCAGLYHMTFSPDNRMLAILANPSTVWDVQDR